MKKKFKYIWGAFNSIIRSGSRNLRHPQYFTDNKTTDNLDEMIKGLNKFFVNVGQQLAEKINNPQINKEGTNDTKGERNLNSMFLRAVEDKEIMDIVNYTLYSSLDLSSFNYCIDIWPNTNKNPLQPTCLAQKKSNKASYWYGIPWTQQPTVFKITCVEIFGSGPI